MPSWRTVPAEARARGCPSVPAASPRAAAPQMLAKRRAGVPPGNRRAVPSQPASGTDELGWSWAVRTLNRFLAARRAARSPPSCAPAARREAELSRAREHNFQTSSKHCVFDFDDQVISRRHGGGGPAERIRGSSDKAAQHLAHALGESVAGGNPGSTYALSYHACITSRCPYKLTYFPGYSWIAIQENSWVEYPGILQRAGPGKLHCKSRDQIESRY